MRNKSNLINKTPLKWLTKEEYTRIVTANPDYLSVLAQKRLDDESFHDIRKKLRVYIINADQQYRILAESKKAVLQILTHANNIKLKQVTRIQVMYETYTKELSLPVKTASIQKVSK